MVITAHPNNKVCKRSKIVLWVISTAIFLIVWQFIVSVFNVGEYLLPSPIVVVKELFYHLVTYLMHVKITAVEALVGFIVGNIFAILSGLIFYRFSKVMQLVMPMVTALQAIPIIALAPLFIVWMGSGSASKIVMAATISFFPTLAAILSGFAEVDQNAQHLFRLYRASYLTTVRHLLFPGALPALVTGLKVSAGLATVGAIVAEMTGADAGIGYLILNSSYRMETVKLFVGIILAGSLGLAGFALPNMLKFIYPHAWAGIRAGDSR